MALQMDGSAQLSILNSLLSSTNKAKFLVPSSMVAFTGYEDKVKEEQWFRTEQTTQQTWVQFREEDEPWPLQIKHEEGYVREQGVEGEYQTQLKKDGFPLVEKDKYKCYYREYFFSPDKKEDLMRHYVYMSRLEDEEVNNIGSVIICCEAKPSPPVPLTKHSIKALVWSKKGQERVTIGLRALSESGSVIKAIKEEAPYLQPIRFNRIKDSLVVKEKLLTYEKQNVQVNYKFGVLFSREHQTTEDQMYNNEHGSPAFEEFLDFLGDRIKLEGFQGYRGGLDVKANTTGTHSVHTQHKGSEIMFHVSTLLQYYPSDAQQVERKRHLGNDVVMIIFREGENEPFSPKWVRSQFNHVFIVVTPVAHPKGKPGTWYKLAISCKEGVVPFQPRLPFPPYLRKGKKAREWFLSKLVNAERAAFHAPDFVLKFRNARKIQLRNIIEECQSEKEGLLARSMTGSKIKNIAKGAKAVIHKGDEGRSGEEDGGTITFMAKWKLSEDAKPDNVIVDVTPREIVFKDPRNDFRVVEKYNYFQIKRWAIGQGVVGLDFGPYRDKGLLKLSTDRSEEIGLLLTEYINVIKTQIDKKKETGGGGGNGSMGPRGGMPQVSGLRDEAEAGSADVLPPPVMMRATMRPSAASPGSPSLGSSPSSPYRSPAMPMAAPASPRGHSVYSASAQTALPPRFTQVALHPKAGNVLPPRPPPRAGGGAGDATIAGGSSSPLPATSPFSSSSFPSSSPLSSTPSPSTSPSYSTMSSPPLGTSPSGAPPVAARRPTPPRPPFPVASFGEPAAPASELNISVSAPPFSPYAPAPAVATGGGPRTATSLSHSAPAKVLPPVPRKVLPLPPAAAQSPPTVAVDAPRRPSTEESTSNNDGGGGSADNLDGGDGEDAPLRPPRPARPIQKPRVPDFLNQPVAPPRTSYRKSRKGGSVIGSPYSGATIRVSRRGQRPGVGDSGEFGSSDEDGGINSPSDLPFLDAELPPIPTVPPRNRPSPPVPPREKKAAV